MNNNKQEESNPLKELRKRLRKTQQEFAEVTGITKATISNVESGKHLLSLRTQKEIALKLNLYDDWYISHNFKEKINVDKTMKDFFKYIKNNVDNDMMARYILRNLNTMIDTKDFSKEERGKYAEYIYVIFRDLAIVASEAKKHIKDEKANDVTKGAIKVANDIIKIPGINKSEDIDILIVEEDLGNNYFLFWLLSTNYVYVYFIDEDSRGRRSI